METKFDKYLVFQLTDWDLFQTVIRLASWRHHDPLLMDGRIKPSPIIDAFGNRGDLAAFSLHPMIGAGTR